MVFRTLSAALAAGFAALAAPAQADVFVQTNAATFLVTPNAPGAGWNTSAAFDASSWQSATELYNVGDYLSGYVAKGIWSSGGQFSTTETSVWARTVWTVGALPASAALTAGFDDDGTVFVNGVQVASSQNGFADNVGPVDLLPYLSLGANVIAFSATDNFPVWGYNHSAWIQVDGTPALAQPVPEPGTYALMLAGLAATAAAVRRRRKVSAACPPPPPAA